MGIRLAIVRLPLNEAAKKGEAKASEFAVSEAGEVVEVKVE